LFPVVRWPGGREPRPNKLGSVLKDDAHSFALQIAPIQSVQMKPPAEARFCQSREYLGQLNHVMSCSRGWVRWFFLLNLLTTSLPFL
jgi:hypothetical protein